MCSSISPVIYFVYNIARLTPSFRVFSPYHAEDIIDFCSNLMRDFNNNIYKQSKKVKRTANPPGHERIPYYFRHKRHTTLLTGFDGLPMSLRNTPDRTFISSVSISRFHRGTGLTLKHMFHSVGSTMRQNISTTYGIQILCLINGVV